MLHDLRGVRSWVAAARRVLAIRVAASAYLQIVFVCEFVPMSCVLAVLLHLAHKALGLTSCGAGSAWLDPFSTLLLSLMTLPRWIDDPTCDSPAMLSAYLNHHLKAEHGDVRV